MLFWATMLHCEAILVWLMNFAMNHAASAKSIAQPVDLQSSLLPLCYTAPYIHHGGKRQICT